MNGQSLDLSEQQLVNCVPVGSSRDNCHGNTINRALTWLSGKSQANALQAFSDMIAAAPKDDLYVGYASYYAGNAYAALGFCGYAVRMYEVVAYGELDLDATWVKAAKDHIKALNADDGAICANWD